MSTTSVLRCTVAALALALVSATAPATGSQSGPETRRGPTVTITDLGSPGTYAAATKITDSGVVIGRYVDDDGDGAAFRWVDGVFSELPGLAGGGYVMAMDVNERGQVVGQAVDEEGAPHAVLWEPDGTFVDLGLPGSQSIATAINRSGAITAYYYSDDGRTTAVVWHQGRITELGDLGGGSTWAFDINDRGQVVGESVDTEGQVHAFRWSDGVMVAMPTVPDTPPGSSSSGVLINRRGDVVAVVQAGTVGVLWSRDVARKIPSLGGSIVGPSDIDDRGRVVGSDEFPRTDEMPDESSRPFLYDGRTVVDLGTLGGCCGRAFAINRHGQVVGQSNLDGPSAVVHATLWDHGQVIDLGTLNGGTASGAMDINGHGDVVGGSLDRDGVEHVVMWTVHRGRHDR